MFDTFKCFFEWLVYLTEDDFIRIIQGGVANEEEQRAHWQSFQKKPLRYVHAHLGDFFQRWESLGASRENLLCSLDHEITEAQVAAAHIKEVVGPVESGEEVLVAVRKLVTAVELLRQIAVMDSFVLPHREKDGG